MAKPDLRIEDALGTIEQAILPNLSMLIDNALDSAALAPPGIDAEAYAAGLRKTARQIGELTALVAAVAPQPAESRERIPA